jgi:pSer/pThr/pTyr-binding forkhead associated (FHA) protein
MIYRLIILNGTLKGQQITVEPEPMIIGRAEDTSIHLPDEEVALRHARVEQRENELFISDLGSMNKIIVNKHEEQKTRLKHGDIIEIGRTRLLVQAIVQAEVQSANEESGIGSRRAVKRKLAIAASVLFVAGATFAIIQSGGSASQTSQQMPLPELEFAPNTNPMIEVTSPAEIPDAGLLSSGIGNSLLDDQLKRIQEDLSFIHNHLQKLNTVADIQDERAKTPATENPVAKINEIEVAMKAARDAMTAEAHDEANLVLEHIQIEYPDYLPAYRLRAELLEKMGQPIKARDQWTFILTRTAESDLYRKAVAERTRLGRSESAKNHSEVAALSISALEQMRFRESAEYDEMRTINVKLSYDKNHGPIDPLGVRLLVYFFQQDLDTKRVSLSSVRPYSEIASRQLTQESGNVFSCTVNYIVPKGYYSRDHNTSRQRYYGCMARLHYFDQVVDEQAKPAKLLESTLIDSASFRSAPPRAANMAGQASN